MLGPWTGLDIQLAHDGLHVSDLLTMPPAATLVQHSWVCIVREALKTSCQSHSLFRDHQVLRHLAHSTKAEKAVLSETDRGEFAEQPAWNVSSVDGDTCAWRLDSSLPRLDRRVWLHLQAIGFELF